MSGGAKGAKRPLRRPLDGGVRPLVDGHLVELHFAQADVPRVQEASLFVLPVFT